MSVKYLVHLLVAHLVTGVILRTQLPHSTHTCYSGSQPEGMGTERALCLSSSTDGPLAAYQ